MYVRSVTYYSRMIFFVNSQQYFFKRMKMLYFSFKRYAHLDIKSVTSLTINDLDFIAMIYHISQLFTTILFLYVNRF